MSEVSGLYDYEQVEQKLVLEGLPGLAMVIDYSSTPRLLGASKDVLNILDLELDKVVGLNMEQVVDPNYLSSINNRVQQLSTEFERYHMAKRSELSYRVISEQLPKEESICFARANSIQIESNLVVSFRFGKLSQVFWQAFQVGEKDPNKVLLFQEAHILEMIASRQDLPKVLDAIRESIEVFSGAKAAIFIVENNSEIVLGGLSNQDVAVREFINTTIASDMKSPWDEVILKGEPIVISDLKQNKNWKKFSSIATKYGIQSLWIFPVVNSYGQTIGIICVCYPYSNSPKTGQWWPIWVHGHMCEIAIEQKRSEDKIAQNFLYDQLTGLANRALFLDRLTQATTRTFSRIKEAISVLYIDLDNFKAINETLGHKIGDEILLVLSNRIKNFLPLNFTPARFGGDDFAVLCDHVSTQQEALDFALQLSNIIAEPMELYGRRVVVTASIGVAVSKESSGAEALLMNADVAMYRAKRRGRGNVEIFEPKMYSKAVMRFNSEQDLRLALERDELFLEYQPKVDLNSLELVGVEALCRWKHPTLGMIPPDKFIPLAEETGLIFPLGEWVLNTAAKQGALWSNSKSNSWNRSIKVSVNVSVKQFSKPNIVKQVQYAIDQAHLDPRLFCLEITESQVIKDATPSLNLIRDSGISISLDDFGTGYCSLSYLKQLPLDEVKIDKSFVDGLYIRSDNLEKAIGTKATPIDFAIIRAVIMMAKALHIQVVGEGVEEMGQVEALRSLGCNLGQGFYFGKSQSAQMIEQLMKNQIQA